MDFVQRESMQDQQLKKAVSNLEKVLAAKKVDDVLFDAICKRFEVCFEYAWKYLKRRADEAGQEVYSPKDALREGVKLKLIGDLDAWLRFLHERNLSVHNYYSGDPEQTLAVIREFVARVKKIK